MAECDDMATTNGSGWRKANNACLVWGLPVYKETYGTLLLSYVGLQFYHTWGGI